MQERKMEAILYSKGQNEAIVHGFVEWLYFILDGYMKWDFQILNHVVI